MDPVAVLLFTTKEDTVNLINELHTAQFTFDNVNMVFFPWNYISNLPRGSIVIRPKQVSNPSLKYDINTLAVLDNGYSRGPVTKDTNRWWVEYHENRHKCHLVIDDDTIFPSTCTNQPTFSSNDETDLTVLNLIVDYVDTTVSIVDELYKSKCPLRSGICDEFKSYSLLCCFIVDLLCFCVFICLHKVIMVVIPSTFIFNLNIYKIYTLTSEDC
jgi:hypothetical protein